MRPIQLIILVVALGAAVVAAMLAMKMTGGNTQTDVVAVAPNIPAEEVLVASRQVSMGGTVSADALVWRPWPTSGMNDAFIRRSDRPEALTELSGMLARSPILDGEPIREVNLVRTDRGFLSAILPKGMRAVAVRVNAASTAGGFILPNDRIDVILTTQSQSGASGATQAVSEILLSNIRVLAIDQATDDPENKKTVVANDTATLELTPEQSQLIIQAQQLGSISLALRSIADAEEPESDTKARKGITIVKFGNSTRVTASQ